MTGAQAMPAAKPTPAPMASKAGLKLAEVGFTEVTKGFYTAMDGHQCGTVTHIYLAASTSESKVR
jgi:hypothetical protein